jgi:hypothetical protein
MSEHKPGALQCACASCFREDPPPPEETLMEATAYAHIQHRRYDPRDVRTYSNIGLFGLGPLEFSYLGLPKPEAYGPRTGEPTTPARLANERARNAHASPTGDANQAACQAAWEPCSWCLRSEAPHRGWCPELAPRSFWTSPR